ncbi:MAG: class I SAM-dependent methyltransferase [Solirubrobacterales bacterium]
MAPSSYTDRVEQERRRYAEQVEVHDLPPIFHYWTSTHLRPIAEEFGFSSPDELFVEQLERAYREAPSPPVRFVSLGSGNCDTEIRLARLLLERGLSDFEFHCLDLNEAMLRRGGESARSAGLQEHLKPIRTDLNGWRPDQAYDGVIANQVLHHLVELETIFDTVSAAMPAQGRFIASDMIGRNGHRRWPEALAIVEEFWRELPSEYRYNVQLDRAEPSFQDWDCSLDGFEGARAQDILPVLVERFDFELFIGFGNVIDPFIDRSFGPHFDPDRQWDRGFIDRVHQRDEEEIRAGNITPTHMFAVMRKRPFSGAARCRGDLTPSACIRR